MKNYLVKPGTKVDLSKIDPNDTGSFEGGKKNGLAVTAKLDAKMDALQETLFAEHKYKILIVLQAMDTAGKDGTIRHVFSGINPQGVRVASFKIPTQEELDHDYLWRIHKVVPAAGELVIFNRSHYEDVLVVKVHKLITTKVCKQRYAQIREFERLLAENGTTIIKFYFHIDMDEQKKRLQARLDDPTKRWKFNTGDLEERKLWPEYMRAYEDAISKTSMDYAPWYIVPANHKWYRDLVISSVLVNTLERLKMQYPQPIKDPESIVIE